MLRLPAAILIACLLALGALALPHSAAAQHRPEHGHQAHHARGAHQARGAYRAAVHHRRALRVLHRQVVRLDGHLRNGVSLRPLRLSWRSGVLDRERDYWRHAAVRVRSTLRAERRAVTERGVHAVAVARSLLGVPYSYGGASPGGLDCSGLTMLVYGRLGVSLDHSSYAQWGAGRHVSRGAMRPGDLVFFDGLGHVGIYAGDGHFIHAPHTGAVVRVDTLDAPGYSLVGADRPAV